MKILKEELNELNTKGIVEIRYNISGKEFWENIEVEQ